MNKAHNIETPTPTPPQDRGTSILDPRQPVVK